MMFWVFITLYLGTSCCCSFKFVRVCVPLLLLCLCVSCFFISRIKRKKEKKRRPIKINVDICFIFEMITCFFLHANINVLLCSSVWVVRVWKSMLFVYTVWVWWVRIWVEARLLIELAGWLPVWWWWWWLFSVYECERRRRGNKNITNCLSDFLVGLLLFVKSV